MSDANSPKRPLIGAFSRDAIAETSGGPMEFMGDALIAGDKTYVPGYSDKRRRFDDALRRGKKPDRLTHRLQWVTTTNPLGHPDNRKVAEYMSLGYRKVKQEDLSGLGLEMPPAAQVNADGSIQLGDTQLFVCGAAQAARNEASRRSAIESHTADEATASALHSEGAKQARRGEELTWSETKQTVEQ